MTALPPAQQERSDADTIRRPQEAGGGGITPEALTGLSDDELVAAFVALSPADPNTPPNPDRKQLLGEIWQLLLIDRNNREGRLTCYFRNHGISTDDALDLVQTIHLRLYRGGLRRYRPGVAAGGFEGFLRGCARHLLIDQFRRRAPGRAGHAPLSLGTDPPALADGPEAQAIAREEADRVRAAVDRLPEPDRAMVLAYWRDGQTLEAVGRANDLSVTGVWRRLQKAAATLQTILATDRT